MSHGHPTPTAACPALPTYHHVGRFMLRAPVLPVDTIVGEAPDRQVLLETMGRLSRTDLVREAIRIASLAAADGVQRAIVSPAWLREDPAPGREIHGGDAQIDDTADADRKMMKQVRRTRSTLFRYLTRMSTRPTPFGLFSGVGFGRFAPDGDLRLGDPLVSRVVARPDAAAMTSTLDWTMAELTAEDCSLQANGLLHHTQAILLLEDSDSSIGEHSSIRLMKNAAVAWVLDRVARGPVTFSVLRAEMTDAFPGADPVLVESMLAQLVGVRVLVPSIGLEIATLDPIGALQDRLEQQPRNHTGTSRTREQLTALSTRAGHLSEHLTSVAHRQEGTLTDRDDIDRATVQVDTALELVGQSLPTTVAEAAEEMAGLLAVLGSVQPAPSHLDAYLGAFMERYGSEAAVPLLDLLSPEVGLGPPDSYTAPRRPVPLDQRPAPASPAFGLLLSAVVDCLKEDKTELVLSDHLLKGLRRGVDTSTTARPNRPSLDIHLQIAAPSLEAVRSGDFTAILAPSGSTDGLRTFGRFSHLMDENWLGFMEKFARQEDSRVPLAGPDGNPVVVVETHYRAPDGRSTNVTFHHRVRRRELNVNVSGPMTPDTGLTLDGILVRADQDGFRFEDADTGTPLHFVQSHLLNYSSAPNPVRFLLEVSDQQFAPPGIFDWGELAHAPFLPRVSRGRLVLSPATWRLSGARLGLDPDRVSVPHEEVKDRLRHWMSRYHVPHRVLLTQADNRLLIDIEQPLAVDELVMEILRDHSAAYQRGVVLQEAWSGAESDWLVDGRGRTFSHEIVVPVLAGSPYTTPGKSVDAGAAVVTRRAGTPRPAVQVRTGDRLLVGEQWTSLVLYTTPDLMTPVIGSAADFFTGLLRDGLAERWFYVCYADRAPLLRVRFRSTRPGHEDQVLAAGVRWARALVREQCLISDFQVSGYVPEIARYGGPLMWEAAQEVFHADSEAARDLRGLMGTSDLPAEVWGAASLVSQLGAWTEGPYATPWTGDSQDIGRGVRKTFKDYGPLLRRLAGTGPAHALPDRFESTSRQIADACARRDETLRGFAGRFGEHLGAGRLVIDPAIVLGSITHLSMNRLLGIDRSIETAAGQLAYLSRFRRATAPAGRSSRVAHHTKGVLQ